MRIGIMGGTFDPIHIGHLMLGEFAYEAYGLDTVWFLPNGNPPHKSNQLMDTNIMHRIEMTKCAIEDVEHFAISLYEIEGLERAKIAYSYETMETFHQLYPNDEFYFIVGADSLFSIEKWKNPKRLFQTCIVLAAFRDDKCVDNMQNQIEYLGLKYGAKIELLSAPLLEISSSTIRDRVKKSYSIRYMVPDKVNEYITAHHLYKDI
ncbi:MAG: nicotinate-nucleotide adenylyltransferase [Lachnospiraceae bacterium]